ncbi:MAG: valine--tRNA ligase [Candidatus Sericytochromatia bacterium]|nr:valine--tRNA ligase [Candidatus Tanganyikabacteria bacterium]
MDSLKQQIREMAKAYEAGAVEPVWLERWERSGAFKTRLDPQRKPYFIPCPPPNVTGALHMGHAVNATIQDVLARSKRMMGYSVLWQPGTDHAGISTQMVVERKLYAETGKTRHDIGREAFLREVWAWKEEYGNTIEGQFRKLGSSMDFSRWRFTMDEQYSRAVRTAFVRLFEKGVIYRGNRIINWCPRCLTSLSDLEVRHETENGSLYYVRYPAADGGEGLVIATVRPETILADVAVAVNPADDRFKKYLGRKVIVPLVDREVPVIADSYVEQEFGTGALKITPGHDPNDFEIGLRHRLPVVDVLTADGKMSNAAGPEWEGMDRFEAREVAVSRLREEHLLVREEPYTHQVGHCDRCHTVVEPRVSEQWFVRMADLAPPAIAVAREGRIAFHPERWRDAYVDWLSNVRDWCISRQLWWGHRIPVWTCPEGHRAASVTDLEACPTCGREAEQDPDVLDTWFSSALWPFATLGWPEQTPELAYFYPGAVLSTARDIINLWVARMVFSSLEFTGKVPYDNVVIHATILAAGGARMSKSKGTGVDPLDMMVQYGTDACRFWMAGAGTAGQDVIFLPEKIEAARNFCNKLWNAARFAVQNLEGADAAALRALPPSDLLEDRWLRSRLAATAETVTRAIEDFTLSRATDALYDFVWGEFCDWWLEIAKGRLREGDKQAQATLLRTLETVLELMHPFTPFITEELYAQLADRGLAPACDTLLERPWPAVGPADPEAERQMNLQMDIVREVRRMLTDLKVPAGTRPAALIIQAPQDVLEVMQREGRTLALTRAEKLEWHPADRELHVPQSASTAIGNVTVAMPLAGLLDLDKERERLVRDIETANSEIGRLEGQLANQGFVSKAPAHVVDKLRTRLAEVRAQRETLEGRLAKL